MSWFYRKDKKISEELLKTRDLLLELDWQGAFNIKEQFNSVKNIFLNHFYNILQKRNRLNVNVVDCILLPLVC